MQTRAVLKGVRLSVDKGRLVADLIRGKKVDQALNILNFTQKKAKMVACRALKQWFRPMRMRRRCNMSNASSNFYSGRAAVGNSISADRQQLADSSRKTIR